VFLEVLTVARAHSQPSLTCATISTSGMDINQEPWRKQERISFAPETRLMQAQSVVVRLEQCIERAVSLSLSQSGQEKNRGNHSGFRILS